MQAVDELAAEAVADEEAADEQAADELAVAKEAELPAGTAAEDATVRLTGDDSPEAGNTGRHCRTEGVNCPT